MFLTHSMMGLIVLTVLSLCLPVWSGEYTHAFTDGWMNVLDIQFMGFYCMSYFFV